MNRNRVAIAITANGRVPAAITGNEARHLLPTAARSLEDRSSSGRPITERDRARGFVILSTGDDRFPVDRDGVVAGWDIRNLAGRASVLPTAGRLVEDRDAGVEPQAAFAGVVEVANDDSLARYAQR